MALGAVQRSFIDRSAESMKSEAAVTTGACLQNKVGTQKLFLSSKVHRVLHGGALRRRQIYFLFCGSPDPFCEKTMKEQTFLPNFLLCIPQTNPSPLRNRQPAKHFQQPILCLYKLSSSWPLKAGTGRR